MSLSPYYVGQTSPIFNITWTRDDGSHPDLTGATLTLVIAEQDGTPRQVGNGVFTILSGPAGTFTYAQTAQDMQYPMVGALQFKAVLTGGGIEFADLIPLTILANL